MTLAAFNCAFSDFGLWTEWQVMHERLRASCVLPSHCVWFPRLWQVRQVADTSRGAILLKTRIVAGSPSSEWAFPGPWQVSQD